MEIPVHHTEWIVANMLKDPNLDLANPELLQLINDKLRSELSLGAITSQQLSEVVEQIRDEQANTDAALAEQLQNLAAYYNQGKKSNTPRENGKVSAALAKLQEDEQFRTTLEKLAARWENDYKDEFPPEWTDFVEALYAANETEE